jgi:hypothetical protein
MRSQTTTLDDLSDLSPCTSFENVYADFSRAEDNLGLASCIEVERITWSPVGPAEGKIGQERMNQPYLFSLTCELGPLRFPHIEKISYGRVVNQEVLEIWTGKVVNGLHH